MPVYDTTCSHCNYVGTESVRIADLTAWDIAAICPQCHKDARCYQRYIKTAPSLGSASAGHQHAGQRPRRPLSKAERDDMRHSHKVKNADQVAAAKEIVATGKYEGLA